MTSIDSLGLHAHADPLAGYEPGAGGHDELMHSGDVRDHWTSAAAMYRSLGVSELLRRRGEIQQLLEEDGVTYNVSAEDRRSRAWTLDPIPFLIPSDEWAVLERGMLQRAELLDLVLDDLYGARRLLRTGLVPPEMILSDPEFQRACDGIRIPGEKQLVVFGSDLARSASGTWMSLGQRTQTPSGAAYALENRRVLSRVFPQMFRAARVERLGPFVQALRAALLTAAPEGTDDPSIVVLSPGSHSETAFEHASIAAQLGFPLVEGSDFECRDGHIGLRTVGGWSRVHVILRRVDAGFCDPLELRSNSTLGIPGLVDACRAGSVSVVNTLGSGILENAGLGTVLATLSRHLLSDDLVLESAPSWWCGDARGLSHVLANLETLVVRPLSRSTLGHSIDTTRASRSELDDVRRRILDRPGQWVGQERIEPASSPVLTDHGFAPRATVLRTFAVAHGDSYLAMQGGLSRAATDDPNMPITNRLGADAKDTWVLGATTSKRTQVWPSDRDIASNTPVETLPARAAEHLYWLGRYAERAEATIRLIRTVSAARDELDDSVPGPGRASLTALLEALTRITGTYPGFVGDDSVSLLADPADELFSLVVDESRPGSIAHAIQHMFEAIDVVRDQLSIDTWLVIGSMQRELDLLEHHADDDVDDRDEAVANVLGGLLRGLLSLAGLADESMVRDHGWQFMEAGRRIERGLHVTALVGSTLSVERSAPVERLIIESVLVAGESIITSRRRFRSRAVAVTTVGLLLDDGGNPRSLRFQLDRLTDSLRALGVEHRIGAGTPPMQLLEHVRSALAATDPERLAAIDDNGHRPELDL
ncbi:MAG: circularly permuted type 2 ATP-grasp protein, partial [Ilumatobacteraceae bacterium]